MIERISSMTGGQYWTLFLVVSEIFREVPGALGHGLGGLPKLRKSVKACSDFFYKM